MTREEEVKQAAYSQYCNSESVCFTLMCDSFKQGAEWADENPKPGLIDLSQVWHEAKEEPEEGTKVVVIDNNGWTGSGLFNPRAMVKGVYIYGDLVVDWYSVVRWAYVDDLLPKGGEL